MENIVGGLALDDTQKEGSNLNAHITKYLNNDPLYPCPILPEQYQASCYFYQTSRMVQLFHGDFTKVASACKQISKKYQPYCFASMGRDVGSYNRGNSVGSITACTNAPTGQLQIECLNGAVQDEFWDPNGADAAITFCKNLRINLHKIG